MENKELIIQSNRMIQAKYGETLTFYESFIFAKMCSMIQPQDVDFQEYKLFVKELLDYCEVSSTGEAYNKIYEAAQRLLGRRITFVTYNEKNQKQIVDTNLVVGITRLADASEGENAYISMMIHPKLKPYLLQLKKDFSQFQLSDYKELHTHTAIRIYEILVSFYGRGQKVVTLEIEELKEMLGLQGKYSHFGGFKKKVLDEAQKRMSESTDYGFTYVVKKVGRFTQGIEFTINRNKPIDARKESKARDISLLETVEDETRTHEAHEKLFEELYPLVKGWGVGNVALIKLIESYPEEKIKGAIKHTGRAEKGGKVENLGGYFVQAVKEGYTTTAEVKKKKQDESKEKVKAEQAKETNIERAKKERYQKERQILLAIMKENPELISEILEAGKKESPITQATLAKYDATQSFEENLRNGGVILGVTLQSVAKDLYPERFNLNEIENLKIKE
jgi:plasmid replication initiation protein